MSKRQRETEFEFEMNTDYIIITYCGKKYAWFPPKDIRINEVIGNDSLEFEICHNFMGKALLNIENMRENATLLRQEINPLQYKDSEEWMADE